MITRRILHIVAAATLLTASPAFAAVTNPLHGPRTPNPPADQPSTDKPQKHSNHSQTLFRAEPLTNTTITDEQGNKLGTIKDLAVDTASGQVAFAILKLGAWSGAGNKNLYAVPFQAVKPNAAENNATLAITRDQLKQAPGFSKKDAPDMSSRAWATQTAKRFGYQPYWLISYPSQQPSQHVSPAQRDQWLEKHGLTSQQIRELQQADFPQDRLESALAESLKRTGTNANQAQQQAKELAAEFQRLAAIERYQRQQQPQAFQPQIHKLSDLVGMKVQSRDQKKLGNLEDLVIDSREDHIAYAILRHGGIIGMGAKLAPVPYAALKVEPKNKLAILDADKATLKNVSFKPSQWPNFDNEQWATRVHQAFNEQPYWQVFGYGFSAGEKPQTIRGKITQVAQTPERHVQLTLKAKNGETYIVDLAPVAFLEQQQLEPKTGQKVTVTGPATYQQNQTMLHARSIIWKGKTVELRDAQGQPKWQESSQQDQQQPQQ